jgi:hypothetical protein
MAAYDPLAAGGVVAKPAPTQVQAPGLVPPPAAPAAPKAYTPQEATTLGLGWVDSNNPNYGKAGFVGSETQAPAAPAATPGAPPAAAPAAPQNTQQVLTGTPEAGPPTTAAGAFQQAMLSKLNPGQVTADSASVAPQIQANQLAQQRGSERQRAQNAERNAAQGTNMSGGATTEQIGLEQDRAAQEGQFNANAIAGQSDKDQQAQMLMSQLAGGMLTSQGGQDVSKYGIDTGAATSKYGIDQGAATSKYGVDANTALGRGDLDLRNKLGTGQLNLGVAGLLQSGDQFNQGLSSNNAQFSAGLNQQALLNMLQGL